MTFYKKICLENPLACSTFFPTMTFSFRFSFVHREEDYAIDVEIIDVELQICNNEVSGC